MKQKLIIIYFLIFLVLESKAQFAIGFGVGYSNNCLNTNIANRVFAINKNGSGFGGELTLNYKYSKKVTFQTGLILLSKNYSFVRTGNYIGIYEDFENTYLQLPLIAQLKLLDFGRVKCIGDIGLFVSYWIFAKVKGVTPNILNSFDSVDVNGRVTQFLRLANYSEKYKFNNLKDNRFEIGWVAGITLNYEFNKKYSSFANCRFYNSISDQQKRYMINQIPKYNQVIFISLGCVMNLTNKKLHSNND